MFAAIKRIIKHGFKNFKRQAPLHFATIFILIIALSLLTSLFLFRSTINYFVSEIQKKIDVSVYFKQNTPAAEIEKIKEDIGELDDIEEVEYISAQRAFEDFKEKHKDEPLILQSVDVLGENPFFPSLNIRAKKPNQYAAVLAYFDGSDFQDIVYKVDYIKKKTIIDRLFSMTSNLSLAGIILSIFLGAVAVLVAFNTIRITIKDSGEEISIMKLVGASSWFVQGPFIVQGILCGLLAALATFFLFCLTAYFSAPKILSITGGFNIFAWFGRNIFNLFLLQFGGGLILSVFSGMIATRKYL